MDNLIKPERLNKGDTIAVISISGGRAGDQDMLCRYETGKKRLKEIFDLHVIETPHALMGSEYLYKNPKSRADDLMWALKNPEVKAIIANMGGDDSYRLLPYIDYNIIHDHPKIMMGYSDITTTCMMFLHAGVMSYYGPNLLTPIAQPCSLDAYTKDAMIRTLFSNDIIGPILPCEQFTKIEWQDKRPEEINWNKNKGYRILQGRKKVSGRLIGGCSGPLRQIMGTNIYPDTKSWSDSILFFDAISPYGSPIAALHEWRALAASGIFNQAAGLIISEISEQEEQILLKVLREEVHREDLPVLVNVDFDHRTPMTILPVGAMAEIDCESSSFTILESGVN